MRDEAAEEADRILDEVEEESPTEFVLSRGQVRELERKQTYVVTCAQNNTRVHGLFWQTLKEYAQHHDAQILVIPMRYRNPTSRRDPQEDDRDQDYWWDNKLHPYLVENEVKIHRKLWVMGQMRIQATAVHPLTGLEGMSHDASAIYGHPQLQMKTVATPGEMPKVLHTTGSCTIPNYSSTKAGKKGEFHHTIGAVVVQKRGKIFHLRHLNWSEKHGNFCDLDMVYGPGHAGPHEGVEALVTGDEHAIWADPKVKQATYGQGGIVDVLKPRHVVRHDVLDSYSISHHHRNDPVKRAVKRAHGYDSVEWELRETVRHIDETSRPGVQNVIVVSNHHEHLMRWLKEADPKHEPQNALLYHRLMAEVLERSIEAGPGKPDQDAFAVWVEKWGDMQSETRFLKLGEPFVVHGVDLSHHGHYGPDGARGSAQNLSKIGTKVITAHRHGPCIEKGLVQVGHSVQELEYLRGPSSWLTAHAILHRNGKRQVIFIIRGEWR